MPGDWHEDDTSCLGCVPRRRNRIRQGCEGMLSRRAKRITAPRRRPGRPANAPRRTSWPGRLPVAIRIHRESARAGQPGETDLLERMFPRDLVAAQAVGAGPSWRCRLDRRAPTLRLLKIPDRPVETCSTEHGARRRQLPAQRARSTGWPVASARYGCNTSHMQGMRRPSATRSPGCRPRSDRLRFPKPRQHSRQPTAGAA